MVYERVATERTAAWSLSSRPPFRVHVETLRRRGRLGMMRSGRIGLVRARGLVRALSLLCGKALGLKMSESRRSSDSCCCISCFDATGCGVISRWGFRRRWRASGCLGRRDGSSRCKSIHTSWVRDDQSGSARATWRRIVDLIRMRTWSCRGAYACSSSGFLLRSQVCGKSLKQAILVWSLWSWGFG